MMKEFLSLILSFLANIYLFHYLIHLFKQYIVPTMCQILSAQVLPFLVPIYKDPLKI